MGDEGLEVFVRLLERNASESISATERVYGYYESKIQSQAEALVALYARLVTDHSLPQWLHHELRNYAQSVAEAESVIAQGYYLTPPE